MTRKPVVAGMFYPEDEGELNEMVDYFIEEAEKNTGKKKFRGVIAPHAGYIFSGRTLGYSYATEIPKRVVVLGVNHNAIGAPVALFGEGVWEVPNGKLTCDKEIADIILSLGAAEIDTLAHSQEHSIEVQIPFLIRKNSEVLITPISIYDYRIEVMKKLGKALAEALKKFPETLIVASSDFTHYEPQSEVERKDALAGEKILANDPEGLVEVVGKHNITMCGLGPVLALLFALPKSPVEKLFYDTSATASGDYSNVVGYASYGIR